jgi:hypothetical protein
MKKLIPILFLCAIPALAAPACATGTYASYQALGAAGCSIGAATFSNFSALTFVNSPGVAALTTSEIQVVPSSTLNDDLLTFIYLNAAGAPTAVTMGTNGQIFAFGLNFQLVFASGTSLAGIQMNSSFGNTAPGTVSASKSVAPLAGGSGVTSTVNDGGKSNVTGSYFGSMSPITGAGPFLITDTTSLNAETGSVTESGFANSFVTGPLAAVTPEIGSLTMMGAGLVFLGLIASSTRLRKRVKS